MLTDSRQLPPESDGIKLLRYARGKRWLFYHILSFNKIVLDILMEKYHIQVDHNTITQSTLLHNNIPGYDLPALNFMSPSEEPNENQILEENPLIYTYLENVLMHMIDEQDA